MIQSIRNIQTVARLCRGHEPLPADLALWLANSLQCFLEQRAASLNAAFGLKNARGGIPWRTEAQNRARDAAHRVLAQKYFAGLSLSARANHIHQSSVRYAASAWRFDRNHSEMPARYRGTAQEFLWQAFKSGATMPLCPRQLRTILAI